MAKAPKKAPAKPRAKKKPVEVKVEVAEAPGAPGALSEVPPPPLHVLNKQARAAERVNRHRRRTT